MTKSELLLNKIEEAHGKLVKYIAIRDGKKTVVTKREYTTDCMDGYKRNSDGKCERMSQEERRNRSKSSSKSSNSSSTKRRRSISMRRRKSLIN